MLPSGFQWRSHAAHDLALYLGEHPVAYLTRLDSGRWRVVLNPTIINIRYVFLSSEPAALAYVEAWARKWQSRLRDEYRNK